MTPVVTAVDLARRGVAALRSSTRPGRGDRTAAVLREGYLLESREAERTGSYPGWRDRLVVAGPQSDDDLERFVLEVRHRTPFVPALAARPVRELVFRGVRVPARRRVLLDVFGTDHDQRLWPEPFRFDPDRFVGRSPGLFELVPQGGGDPARGHRCPGEGATTALLRGSVAALVRDLSYEVPDQDLSVSAVRFLGLPRSRLRVRGLSVRAAQQV